MPAINNKRIQAIQTSKQRGFILLPVVLAITLIAAVAYLMNLDGAMNVNSLGKEVESSQARFIAKAGMNQMLWQANKSNCTGYANLTNAAFGTNSYSATITPASISVTGTQTNGASYSIQRDLVKVYQTPTTKTLQLGTDPGMDAVIDSAYSTANFGIGDNGVLQTWIFIWFYRNQLIQFDLSSIPAAAHINSAQLQLYQKSGMGTADVTVHRVKNSWVEGTKSGSGTADGATWKTTNGTAAWTTNGGDYDATAIASTTVTDGSGATDSWEIAPLVQDWLAGNYANNGMLLKAEGNISHTFASKEDTTAVNRPKLTITYACECGKTCSCTPGNFRDQFASIAYTGNNGSFTWTNNWQETGETDGPTTGKLSVISDTQCASGNCMKLRNDTSTVMRLTREANLATAVSASLNFSYRRGVFGTAGGAITLEISKNGGSTFTLLKTYQLNAADTSQVSESVDISPYLAANTQIRFSTNGSNFQTNIFVDNVDIITSCVPAPTLVTLNPVADNYLDQGQSTRNYGISNPIGTFVKGGKDQRIVTGFDVTAIPAGALINSATLRYHVSSITTPSTSTKTITAYKLTQSWLEGTKNGVSPSDGASWQYRDGGTNWTTSGGTYNTTAIDMATEESSSISPPPASFTSGWLTWDLTTLVQEWVDGISVNNGVLLVPTTPSGKDQILYESREASSNKPQLVITYTAP